MAKAIWRIMRREWQYMWYDHALRNLMIFVPLITLTIFSFVYYHDAILSIPTAIADLDRSSVSREIVDELTNHENLKVIAYYDNYDDLQKAVAGGDVVAGIVVPENLAQDISRKQPTRIYMAVDGTNIAYSTNATTALMEIAGFLSAKLGVKSILAQTSVSSLPGTINLPSPSMDPAEALSLYQPVNFIDEPRFNPTLSYRAFLLLVLFLNIWQQCCTLLGCNNIIGETGMYSWVQVKSSGFSMLKLFFAKSVAQISICLAAVLPLYLCGFLILKLPLEVSFGFLLLFTLIFILALHALATLMSSVAKDAVDASRFGMLIALPSFVMCGYTWPLEMMPDLIVRLAKMLPQTWFFQGLGFAQFKSASNEVWGQYFAVLLGMAVLFYCLAAAVTYIREKS